MPDLVTVDVTHPEDVRVARPERIVVAGGDGSIGCAAELAAELRVPLAVIPVGTANDFVRAMGLPREREAAIELAVTAKRTRRLDLAFADRPDRGSEGARPFVNAASAGLSPIAARRARPLKRPLGPLAYVVGALHAAFTARPMASRVSVDEGEVFAGRAWQVTVACTGAFGAGAEIDADPGDGVLDVIVIEASSRVRLLVHAYGLRTGTVERRPDVHRAAGRAIEVDCDGEGFNIDGELVEARRLRFTVQARAFEVVVG